MTQTKVYKPKETLAVYCIGRKINMFNRPFWIKNLKDIKYMLK